MSVEQSREGTGGRMVEVTALRKMMVIVMLLLLLLLMMMMICDNQVVRAVRRRCSNTDS